MNTMHMIGNGHIDPVWLWDWREGLQEVKATFRSALDRMNEFDGFVFTASSAALYEWVEHSDPAMFEEIRRRVREGRWAIVGGWYVEPDCNIPCDESFARHALISQRYFQEKFGKTCTVGYTIDSFGHCGTLPQMLRCAGMDSYVFMRPGPHEKYLPSRLFTWESDDGSRVTAFQLPFEYCAYRDLEGHIDACRLEMPASADRMMCFYGVGNHGGGPTIENIRTILARQEAGEEIAFSDPAAFFAEVRAGGVELPVVHDDLQHHAPGCYSVHSGVKRMNRSAENLLLKAEKISTIAFMQGLMPECRAFERGWKDVLFNQFHDTLAGTALSRAYADAQDAFGEARSIAGRAMNQGMQALSWRVEIPKDEDTLPAFVMNPHPWPVRENVEIEGRFHGQQTPYTISVEDDAGAKVECQMILSDVKVNGVFRVTFVAELPPMGYRVYSLRKVEGSSPRVIQGAPCLKIENSRYRLAFDEKTGGLASLYDKQSRLEFLSGVSAVPTVLDDPTDTWAHGNLFFDREIGVFEPESIRLVEDGPVRRVLRVTSRYGRSSVRQDFVMTEGLETIEVRVRVNWQERRRALKLYFTLNQAQPRAVYEVPFGVKSREANGSEEAYQKWLDVSGQVSWDDRRIAGLGILNDGKYSASVRLNRVGFTVLRSPVYAHHDPYQLSPEEDVQVVDQGEQSLTYRLLPHLQTWRESGVVRRALELNQPAEHLIETFHPGDLPRARSFAALHSDHVILTALKRAEEGDGMIVRLYESEGRAEDTTLEVGARSVPVRLKPWEIVTLLLPDDPSKDCARVDFMEWRA